MMRSRRNFVFLIIFTLTIGLTLFFVIPSVLRAKISSSLASYRAVYQLYSIPLPSGAEEIDSYQAGSVSRNTCYSGEAFSINGTNLDVGSIGNFYEAMAVEKGWKVSNKLNTSSQLYFFAVSKKTTYTGRAVKGLSVQVCDDECLLNYDFSNELVNLGMKKYKNIYVVKTWFVPFEIRNNLCGCCSGG